MVSSLSGRDRARHPSPLPSPLKGARETVTLSPTWSQDPVWLHEESKSRCRNRRQISRVGSPGSERACSPGIDESAETFQGKALLELHSDAVGRSLLFVCGGLFVSCGCLIGGRLLGGGILPWFFYLQQKQYPDILLGASQFTLVLVSLLPKSRE